MTTIDKSECNRLGGISSKMVLLELQKHYAVDRQQVLMYCHINMERIKRICAGKISGSSSSSKSIESSECSSSRYTYSLPPTQALDRQHKHWLPSAQSNCWLPCFWCWRVRAGVATGAPPPRQVLLIASMKILEMCAT